MGRKTGKEYLSDLITEFEGKDTLELEKQVVSLVPMLPFNEFEFLLVGLRDKGLISLDDYRRLRKIYTESNKNLMLYGIDSRLFAEVWAVEHLKRIDPRFKVAHPDLDAEYIGQYDSWFEELKLGVKASRAINQEEKGNRLALALRFDTHVPFALRFRHLSIETCDIFVLIGVWVDCIHYWVLSCNEIKGNPHLFRDSKASVGTMIVINDQNIHEFQKYNVQEQNIANTVIQKSKR